MGKEDSPNIPQKIINKFHAFIQKRPPYEHADNNILQLPIKTKSEDLDEDEKPIVVQRFLTASGKLMPFVGIEARPATPEEIALSRQTLDALMREVQEASPEEMEKNKVYPAEQFLQKQRNRRKEKFKLT